MKMTPQYYIPKPHRSMTCEGFLAWDFYFRWHHWGQSRDGLWLSTRVSISLPSCYPTPPLSPSISLWLNVVCLLAVHPPHVTWVRLTVPCSTSSCTRTTWSPTVNIQGNCTWLPVSGRSWLRTRVMALVASLATGPGCLMWSGVFFFTAGLN